MLHLLLQWRLTRDIYDHSSVITVTGQTEPVDPEGSQVIYSGLLHQDGNPVGLTHIAQVSVNNDGNFSTTISTATR